MFRACPRIKSKGRETPPPYPRPRASAEGFGDAGKGRGKSVRADARPFMGWGGNPGGEWPLICMRRPAGAPCGERRIHSHEALVSMRNSRTDAALSAGEVPAAGRPASGAAMLVVCAIVVGALYFGRDVLVPLALALLLSFVLAPGV